MSKTTVPKISVLAQIWAMCIIVTILSPYGLAHPAHTDPVLSELNDYLVAIQLLKENDSRAEELYQLWLAVRNGSWHTRELVDKQNLTIDAPEVVSQIHKTRKLRTNLVEQCRSFWSNQTNTLPVIRFTIGKKVGVDWSDAVIETKVGSRKLVLIEIHNVRKTEAYFRLFSDASRQILFWEKSISLKPKSSRYSFVYVAPSKKGKSAATISLRDKSGHTNSVTVRACGISPPTESILQADEKLGQSKAKTSAGSIQFRIRDSKTNKPLPVRVEVRDAENKAYWTPLHGPSYAVSKENSGWHTPLWQFQTGPYFYIGEEARLGVTPSGKMVRIYHGFEYEPVVMSVPDNGIVDVTMKRWINMPEKGWYSGQTHVHTTDIGTPVSFSRFWPLIARAEDLHISHILTLKGEWATPIYANEYPMGVVPWASEPEHIIAYGQEYRSNPYGHLCLLGIDEMIEPISSGALGELGGPDYPPNTFILDAALEQNGVTVGAHFGLSIMEKEPIKSGWWPSTGFEMPIDVALGKIQVAEIYGNGGQVDIWYKLLNCGFEVAATAGPDWAIKDTPRVYVHLGKDTLSFDRWNTGLKQGNSFITRGPMLFFTINGAHPGTRLHYPKRPQEVAIQASALMPDQSIPVEIVINGNVVAKGTDLSQSITLRDSCWIAARCNDAHTSPVYITLQDRPQGSPKDARDFIEVIDRLEEWVLENGLFDTPQQKKTVINVIRQGRAVYESIEKQAMSLNR